MDLDVEMIELEIVELEMELDCAEPGEIEWLEGQLENAEERLKEALKAWN